MAAHDQSNRRASRLTPHDRRLLFVRTLGLFFKRACLGLRVTASDLIRLALYADSDPADEFERAA
jgi:hypothetical protein